VTYIRTKPELTGEICIYRSCGCITAKATKPVGHRFTDKNLQIYVHHTEYAAVRDESQLNKQWVFVEIFSS
jgi:hypothetical protein